MLRFGYVGGAEIVKGFPQLRAAFEGLARSNWELVLIDNTLNLGFASIDVRDWRHSGSVVAEPAYSQEGLDAFFESIDVLVFPSQWKESFGLTVREALARDVWVIATDCGGPGEAIADGVNGNLLPMDGRHENCATPSPRCSTRRSGWRGTAIRTRHGSYVRASRRRRCSRFCAKPPSKVPLHRSPRHGFVTGQ